MNIINPYKKQIAKNDYGGCILATYLGITADLAKLILFSLHPVQEALHIYNHITLATLLLEHLLIVVLVDLHSIAKLIYHVTFDDQLE